MTSLPHDAQDSGPRTSAARTNAPTQSAIPADTAAAGEKPAAKRPAAPAKSGAVTKPAAARTPASKAAPAKATPTKAAPTKAAPATGASTKAAPVKAAPTKTTATKTTATRATATKAATAKATPTKAATAKAAPTKAATASKTAAAKKATAAANSVTEAAAEPAVKPATGQKPAATRKPASAKPATAAKKPATRSTAAEIVDDGQLALAEAPAKAEPPAKAEAPAAAPAASAASEVEQAKAPAAPRTTSAKPDVAKEAALEIGSAKKASITKAIQRPAALAPSVDAAVVLRINGLSKHFGEMTAVNNIELSVRTGSFYGIVGPNGAGKTTTLSMVTGLLRPDAGSVSVHGIDVWGDPVAAKRAIGVLPDRLRLFDRLTGAQLLYYSGILRGLDNATVRERSADLAAAFGLEEALNRLVADYSAGMTKKIALACAMIHSPRLLVLDEPFEAVDPVSAANLTEILQKYVAAGGTVVLSSHGMDLIERVCDSVAIIVHGEVLASGTLDEVRGKSTLEERFVELAGGRKAAEGMEWLHSFSD